MKKIIPLLGIFFLLTSCYSNPKDTERIEELEKKVAKIENNTIYDEKDYIFGKNKECSAYREGKIRELESTFSIVGKNQSFYSSSLNSCIIAYIGLDPENFTSLYIIEDLISGEEINSILCFEGKCDGNENSHFTMIEKLKN